MMLSVRLSVVASPTSTALALFLIQVLVIISLVRILGRLLIKIRQPMVIGEIIAGILLGPSAFGRIPGFTENIFPPSSLKDLKLFADIGLIFFMFFLGLEVDLDHMKRTLKQSISIAAWSSIVPFGCGAGLSVWFFNIETIDSNFVSFLLFLGTALSFTAFPVLARVLTSSQLLASPVGGTALGSAAVDDLLAWLTLALTLSYSSGGGPLNGLYVALVSVALIMFLALVIHPFLTWYHQLLISRNDELNRNFLALLFLLLCLTSWFSEILGIEAFCGAFIFGIMVPKGGTLIDNLAPKIELLIVEFFLPLYFANSGIRTDIGGLDGAEYWAAFVAVTAIGSAAKIFPVTWVARWTVRLNKNGGLYNKAEAQSEVAGGDDLVPALHTVEQIDKGTPMPWRQCFTLGILMNTRGLVGLIVLNIGLSANIIGPKVFTIMVLFSLVTTFATPPALYFLYEKPYHALRKAQLEAVALIRQQSALLETVDLGNLKTPEEDHTCIPIGEEAQTEAERRLQKAEALDGVGEIHRTGSSKGVNGTQSKHGHMVLPEQEEDDQQTHPALQASMVASAPPAAGSSANSTSPTPLKTNDNSPVISQQFPPQPLTALQLEKQEADLLATQLAAFGYTTHASIEAARREPSDINLTGGTTRRNKPLSRQQSMEPNSHPIHSNGSEWSGGETPMIGSSLPMGSAPAPPVRSRQRSMLEDFLLGPLQSPLESEASNLEDTELRSLSTRHAIALAQKKDAEEQAEIEFILNRTTAAAGAAGGSRPRSGTLQGHLTADDINAVTQSSHLHRRMAGGGGGGGGGTNGVLYDDINSTGTSGFGRRARQLSNQQHGLTDIRRASFDPTTASLPINQHLQHYTYSPSPITSSSIPPSPSNTTTSLLASSAHNATTLLPHHLTTSSTVTGSSSSHSMRQTTNSSSTGLTGGLTSTSNSVIAHANSDGRTNTTSTLPPTSTENSAAKDPTIGSGGGGSTQYQLPPFDRIESNID